MKRKTARPRKRNVTAAKIHWQNLLLWIAACELIGILGSFATVSAIPSWYVTLTKPWFSPPNWVFGPVWTVLYALMGIAAYRISRLGMKHTGVARAMVLFGLQLFLNAIWSPIFFGYRNIALGFADISLLWVLIILTIIRFRKLDMMSAWLMMPYLLWVSFATVLNYHLLLLNPS